MKTVGRSLLAIVVSGMVAYALPQASAVDFTQTLLTQSVAPEEIVDIDSHGIPRVCGTGGLGSPAEQPTVGALPVGTRGWETIPGVVRNDGQDAFRLEVDVNGPVRGVTLDNAPFCLFPPGPGPFALRDDGQAGDRVAGDFVFTSGPFSAACFLPPTYRFDPDSPAGLSITDIGAVSIQELDGTTTQFLLRPAVGLLAPEVAATTATTVSSDIVLSPHLINIRTSTRATQQFIRFRSEGVLQELISSIYTAVPDRFDFFMLFSTDKIEGLPALFSRNFVAGTHVSAQVNVTGVGQSPFDNTAPYGSRRRLLGVNVLDTLDRGIGGRFATHELLHQWVAYISPSFGLSDGVHYFNSSSVGSLVGGFLWVDNGNGTFTRDCNEGANGAHHAPPLDKYMMGLIDGTAVAPLNLEVGTLFGGCGVVAGPIDTITINDIQGVHGIRSPGAAQAQRDFSIAFVAETHERFLNATELTFYEILAQQYTAAVPPEHPDPYVGDGWPPITRFFDEGTTWSSSVSPSTTTTIATSTSTTTTTTPLTNRCPQGLGFWKNHPGLWPVSSLTLGSQSYAQAELLTLLTAPVGGNASLLLDHQLIAAKLNMANGSDSTPVASTIADADSSLSAFSGELPHRVRTNSPAGQRMVNDASTLDSYNNGTLTPTCMP